MTKTKHVVRAKLKSVRRDEHASCVLRALRASGLFRWERKSTRSEEVLNILTHGVGIGLAIAGLTLLVVFAGLRGNAWSVVSCAIFGATMITLYFGSTMCHALIGKRGECFFEVWDNIAIYALIAGTYTPFLLVNLRGGLGWTVFGILWAITIIGAIVKIRNPHQQPKWTVGLYLLMGWALLFILPAMIRNIPLRGLWFILAGGLSYTVGVIFYLWRKLKFSHALWHLFVIAGTVCFFFAVLYGCILDL
ncbi:MAG: hemolysin III family protein [Alphaproteobacteria bacterium]|nr:hemolysin III family protein [Alphaproteobacteria bacterium]